MWGIQEPERRLLGRRGGRAQLRSSQDRGRSWTSSKSLQGVRMGVGRLLGGLIDARAVG